MDAKIDNEKNDFSKEIKEALHQNTKEAVEKGVFGVPTLYVDNQLFWGADSFEMFCDFLNNPLLFESEEMKKIQSLNYGAIRAPH